jgi:transcriptional regulator NrdR family protein
MIIILNNNIFNIDNTNEVIIDFKNINNISSNLYHNNIKLDDSKSFSFYNIKENDLLETKINVIKRDNSFEEYNKQKIENVLKLAFKNSNTECDKIYEINNFIFNEINELNTNLINIENIQDIIEKTLMIYSYYNTAKHYISYRNDRSKKRKYNSYVSKIKDDVETPWGMLGYITYKRTYARKISNDENNETTEEFRDSILRVLDACQNQLNCNFSNNELKKAYYYLKSLKGSVAGRFLWQLGTETVNKLGTMSLQNCAYVSIDDPIRPFTWIFDVLMLGTGVGFSVQKEYISKLPPVLDVDINIKRLDTKDADFIVPDSREGWVYLLEKILETFFYKGKSFTYSTILIRSAGTKIKGFGGVASGPEDLVKGLKNIIDILKSKKGKQLSSIDVLDIVNIIATIVVAGNVRRCIPKESKVFTKKGLVNIEDIITGDEALTTDGYRKITNYCNQGKQKIVKIKTENGYFRCTSNHRMAVYVNDNSYIWKMTEDLKQDELLITNRDYILGSDIKLPPCNNYNRRDRINIPEFTKDIAWLFGYFIGNGYIDNALKKIKICCYTEEIYNKVKKIFVKFGENIRTITDIDKINNNYFIEFISLNLLNYFNDYVKTNDIVYFINETTYENRIEYIRGVLNSKYCPIKTPYYSIAPDINNNSKWLRSFQTLCYSCGFQSKYIETKTGYKLLIDNINAINIIENKTIECNNYEYATSKIISITSEENEVETYDIEVEDKHEFFCDGYLTHNSALICLGDCNDKEYLNAKNWGNGNIPNWRSMSNNSVVCNDINDLPEEFWELYNGNSEPYGLINIELSRKVGRVKDGDKYQDPTVQGVNPCGEILISNSETCNLSEIFLPNIKSYEELKELTTILYRICKQSLTLNCHHKETENIIHKNYRIGVGITGYMMCSDEQKSWLDPLYNFLREYDVEYSKTHNLPTSIKLTTVKPSGTLSLLAGVTPGAHPGIYKYFIRRIRISVMNKTLLDLCKKNGYKIEYQRNFDGTDDKNTKIIEFPCKYPDGTIIAKDLTAIDQLNVMKELQYIWSDNAVSITVYYKLEELEDIKKWLRENYKDNIKSVSFLLLNKHGFIQAPYEEITKEKYDDLIANVKPITSGDIHQETDLESDCVGNSCPVK